MSAAIFDTLKLVDILETVRLPREQARAIVEVVRESHEATLAGQSKVAQDASERAVTELDTKTERAVAALDTKMERMVTALDAKTERMVAALGTKTEQMVTALDAKTEQMVAALGTKTEQMVTVLDAKTERAGAALEKRIQSLETKMNLGFSEIHGEIRLLKWMLGISIAGVFSTAAAVVPLALKTYFNG